MAMRSVGTTLRHARERRGLTLKDVGDRTNIPTHLLDAIERNAFDELPGGLLARGHVRAFASEVGMDGESWITEGVQNVTAPLDLLQLLRVRFKVAERRPRSVMEFLLVLVCLAGLLFFATVQESEREASAETAQEEAVGNEDS